MSIPFDKLHSSAILSKLVYLEPKELVFSYVENLYDNPNLLLKIKTFLDNSNVKYHNNTKQGAQAYVWISERSAYLVFRGTESCQDVLTNLDIRYKQLGINPKCKVHRGFHKQFNSIESDITKQLDKNVKEFDEIYCIGHSLGSGLATLAAAFYAYHFYMKHINLHTFGSPRVGNKMFTKCITQKHIENWRVFGYDDIVSHIPISCCHSHIKKHSVELKQDSYKIKEADDAFLRRLFKFVQAIPHLFTSFGHDIDDYILRLQKMKNR